LAGQATSTPRGALFISAYNYTSLTPRQDLANANYQALLKKRVELGRKIAAFDVTGKPPDAKYIGLRKQYDALAVQLEEAEEECKQADAAAIREKNKRKLLPRTKRP
jgi:hypothetical protein